MKRKSTVDDSAGSKESGCFVEKNFLKLKIEISLKKKTHNSSKNCFN